MGRIAWRRPSLVSVIFCGMLAAAMTHAELTILDALIELETAVQSIRSADPKPDLTRIFSRLDDLTRQLPKDTAPDLLHYLNKKSYRKARLWLQGRDAENAEGNCGHV